MAYIHVPAFPIIIYYVGCAILYIRLRVLFFTGCGFNEFTCRNGNCIPQSFICDGDNDCNDYSDVQSCCMYMYT